MNTTNHTSPSGEWETFEEREAFEEIRSALDETYGFASTSPRSQENINFVLEKLDEIESARAALTAEKAGAQAGEPTAVPPRWYTVGEIRHTLKLMNYCDYIAIELSAWFVRHLQLAFNKGFEKGQRTTAPQPAQPTQGTLSDEQCKAIEQAMAWAPHGSQCQSILRALLSAHNGGKHE